MKRRKGIKRTPLETVEQLATERFGVGSAISLDRDGVFTVATVWDRLGASRCTCSRATRQEAIAGLRRRLEETERLEAGELETGGFS